MSDTIPENTPQKQCPRCKEWKPLTTEFFYPNKTKPSGFEYVCKRCILTKVPSFSPINQNGEKQCYACKEYFPQTNEFFGIKAKGRNGLDSYCKKCRHEYKIAQWAKEHPPKPKEAPDGFKKCTDCQQILPYTIEYFHAMSKNKSGLRSQCKKCCASRVAHPRPTKCNTPGFKICTKCLREIPATPEFFHHTTGYKDGLAGKCKECVNAEYRATHAPRKLVSDAPDGFKRCAVCRENIPANLDHFHALHSERDGLHKVCKACRTKKRIAWRLLRIKEYQERERAIHRNNAEYYRRYHEANRERILERGRQHYYERIEYYREQGKRYRKTLQGQERRRVRDRNRRAQLRKAGGTLTHAEIKQQYQRQKGRCYYCKGKIHLTINGKAGYHADHVVPISRGGTNDISNIVLTCPTCNLKKGDKMPHEWNESGKLF